MMKHPVTGKSIVRDGLVLQHNYNLSSVEPLSSGAADINADAAANEYIDVGVIPITTNDVTISTWVHITTWVNYAPIFSNRSASGTNPGIELRCANGVQKLQLLIDDANGSSSAAMSSALNSNQWYHVCGVWDRSGDMSLYIDGVLDGTDDITGNPLTLTHSTSAKIGATGSTEMRGYICNVGYWNAALSQAQVKSIMNKNYDSLSASEKTDLVSWWNLDSAIEGTSAVYDNHYGGGETLGTDKVTDGTFINGLDSWSASGPTESGGVVRFSGGTDNIFQSLSYTDNKVYAIALEGTGDAKVRVGYSGIAATQTVVGTLPATLNLFVDSTANRIQVYKNSGDELLLTSVSVKEINGNTGTLS
tara:strand:- start:967 stop:2052 length:1086 start_codon:yes stop_codon:yes gene_type:complete